MLANYIKKVQLNTMLTFVQTDGDATSCCMLWCTADMNCKQQHTTVMQEHVGLKNYRVHISDDRYIFFILHLMILLCSMAGFVCMVY